MTVSIAQVAVEAKVSSMTVSRVLSDKGSVSAPTRQRVLQAMQKLGYVPSSAARALRSKDQLRATASNCFALIFGPDTQLADDFFCDVARGAEKEAARHSLCPLQVHWQDSFERSWPRLQTLFTINGLCGTLLAGQFQSEEVQAIQKHNPHIVVVDGPVPAGVNAGSVESDNFGGCRLALQHLLTQGCRRLLILSGPETHYFSHAMNAAAHTLQERFESIKIIATDYTAESGREAALNLFANEIPFNGIFANDTVAFGVLRGLAEKGIQVPGQVKVIGFDNIIHGRFSYPSLSSVEIDKAQLGAEAVKCLTDMVRGQAEPSQVKRVIQAKLIIRESTQKDAGVKSSKRP